MMKISIIFISRKISRTNQTSRSFLSLLLKLILLSTIIRWINRSLYVSKTIPLRTFVLTSKVRTSISHFSTKTLWRKSIFWRTWLHLRRYHVVIVHWIFISLLLLPELLFFVLTFSIKNSRNRNLIMSNRHSLIHFLWTILRVSLAAIQSFTVHSSVPTLSPIIRIKRIIMRLRADSQFLTHHFT